MLTIFTFFRRKTRLEIIQNISTWEEDSKRHGFAKIKPVCLLGLCFFLYCYLVSLQAYMSVKNVFFTPS